MSSLFQMYSETTPVDALMKTQKLLNIAVKRSTPKFTNSVKRVSTDFVPYSYLYQLNDDTSTYNFEGPFSVCFWCKFKDLGNTDVAYGNVIKLILNDGTVISADISNIDFVTDFKWIKIVRDANNDITISVDNVSVATGNSSAAFNLSDNSYIFVGNVNRWFTGYEAICDDILILSATISKLSNIPDSYLPLFQQLLYIKVSDGSVWGYKED